MKPGDEGGVGGSNSMADDSMGDVENEVTVALNPDKDTYDLNSACDTINNNNSENSENNNHNKHNSNIGMNKAKTIQKNNNHNNDHNNDSDNNNVNKHHNEPDHSSAHPPCNLPSATTGDEAAANNININSSNDNSIHNYNRINNDRKNNDDAHPASKSPRQSPRKTTSAKATAKSKSARKSPRTQPTARAGEVDQADVDNAHDTMVPGGDLSRTRSSGQASDHATAIPRGLGKHFEMPCMQWYTRWHVLVLMILLALMTGIIFVFSLYSADVQHRLGWNDDEVNLLGAQKVTLFCIQQVWSTVRKTPCAVYYETHMFFVRAGIRLPTKRFLCFMYARSAGPSDRDDEMRSAWVLYVL